MFLFVRAGRGGEVRRKREERLANAGLQRRGRFETTGISLLMLAAVALTAGLAGCHKASTGQHYEFKGKVLEVDNQLRRVTVAHDAIPGYMEAMTMPFVVKDEWVFGVARPGDSISAVLVVDRGQSWLENAVITEPAKPDPSASIPEAEAGPKPGDEIRDFSLTNQDANRIHLNQYRGRALVLTFVYTRCPLPDFCPLMSSNFAEVDKELQKSPGLYAKTHLLSVTIDPEFDTPQVMQNYGENYTKDTGASGFDHWEFATGSKDEIKSIAEYFGLRYWNDGSQIVHSLRTAVISPDGKLVKLYIGNDWKPEDIVSDIKGLKLT
jgi:protein SCO1/2